MAWDGSVCVLRVSGLPVAGGLFRVMFCPSAVLYYASLDTTCDFPFLLSCFIAKISFLHSPFKITNKLKADVELVMRSWSSSRTRLRKLKYIVAVIALADAKLS